MLDIQKLWSYSSQVLLVATKNGPQQTLPLFNPTAPTQICQPQAHYYNVQHFHPFPTFLATDYTLQPKSQSQLVSQNPSFVSCKNKPMFL